MGAKEILRLSNATYSMRMSLCEGLIWGGKCTKGIVVLGLAERFKQTPGGLAFVIL
jgi:hypothetical protein